MNESNENNLSEKESPPNDHSEDVLQDQIPRRPIRNNDSSSSTQRRMNSRQFVQVSQGTNRRGSVFLFVCHTNKKSSIHTLFHSNEISNYPYGSRPMSYILGSIF